MGSISTAQQESIIACKQLGMSYRTIAQHCDCALQTVTNVLTRHKARTKDGEGNQLSEARIDALKRRYNALIQSELQRVSLNSLINITDKKMEEAPPGTLSLIACQTIDKLRLIEGKSTENVSVKGFVEHIIDNLPVLPAIHDSQK